MKGGEYLWAIIPEKVAHHKNEKKNKEMASTFDFGMMSWGLAIRIFFGPWL
jgi:hypothetical protein